MLHVAIAAYLFPILSTLLIVNSETQSKEFAQLDSLEKTNSVFMSPTSSVTVAGQGFLVSLCNCIALILVGAIDHCASMYSAATDCSVLFCSAQPIISSPMEPPYPDLV